MRPSFILSLDQGTTSSRTLLFQDNGLVVAEANAPLPLVFPQPGWVEADGEALFASQWQAVQGCLAVAKGLPDWHIDQIRAIGIANQRETTLLWERSSGRLVHPAILWYCRRSAPVAQQWRELGLESVIRERTGLNLDPYFSATKLGYLFQTYPELLRRAQAGELLFGTVDSFLVYRLSGHQRHITDVTNASRTAFFDIKHMEWDQDLLSRMGIPEAILPEVVDTAGVLATTHPSWFGRTIPIASLVGDQQAALFGQGCHSEGKAKCTIGTGAFVLAHAGSDLHQAPEALIRTVAWRLSGHAPAYAWEGAVFTAGALINWLRDGLAIIQEPRDTEVMARSVADTGGVVMVPAFSGLATPYWDPAARGLLIGMTSKTSRAHLVRAALESIAFQIVDVLRAMEEASDTKFSELKVDGGVAQNDFLTQFLADVSDMGVVRYAMAEATARGAAWLAGLGSGLWPSLDCLPTASLGEPTLFSPVMSSIVRLESYARWQRAVVRSQGWDLGS